MPEITRFISGLPKAEIHCHIEGTLEPELMFELAGRNGVRLAFDSVEALRAAYRFNCLQEFLDLYYQGMAVLQTEADFYDLTRAYLQKAVQQNVRHTEIFFDPQAHLERGVALATVVDGISAALAAGQAQLGLSSHLILCFLRHLDEQDAVDTLEMAMPHRDKIIGVGLDSSERGNPPQKFRRVFSMARERGFRCVAHAGEEGPPEYVRDALDLLRVARIDHGNAAVRDPALMARLAREGTALTVCPLSNLKLRVVATMAEHPLPVMLEHGLQVTINSDDPAYFGGYINENYEAVAQAFALDKEAIAQLARNAVRASFAAAPRRRTLLAEIDEYHRGFCS